MAKFRSWNEVDKRFYYWENGEYCAVNEDDVSDYDSWGWGFNWQNAEQSTGLFDYHNKEIFDGDIVDSWYGFNIKNDNGFKDSYFRTVEKNKEQPCLQFNPLSGYMLCKNNSKNFLIIGNIHENMENK